ncbi:hypothetical protein KCP70_19360 [Salmonella enterica subsp. enterica]|nr:hypothetical protein KCP70_19360 [Salmonella enterica subsp. enterica]
MTAAALPGWRFRPCPANSAGWRRNQRRDSREIVFNRKQLAYQRGGYRRLLEAAALFPPA